MDRKEVLIIRCPTYSRSKSKDVAAIISATGQWTDDQVNQFMENPGKILLSEDEISQLIALGVKICNISTNDNNELQQPSVRQNQQYSQPPSSNNSFINQHYPLNNRIITSPWRQWTNIPSGSERAFTALIELRNHTEEYKSQLKKIRDEWINNQVSIQKAYENDINSAKIQFNNDITRIINEYSNNVQTETERKVVVSNILQACDEYISSLQSEVRFQIKNGATNSALIDAAQKTEKAIDVKMKVYEQLRDIQKSEREQQFNLEISRKKREKIEHDKEAEMLFTKTRENYCKNIEKEIENGFNRNDISDYSEKIIGLNKFIQSGSYKPVTDIPEAVMIGRLGLVIPIANEDEHTVVQAVKLQTSNTGIGFESKDGTKYYVTIPFAQKIKNGISLMIRYSSPDERDKAQEMIKSLLLKLFLSIPAGKLFAEMIDPKISTTFNDILSLGGTPRTNRIINSNVIHSEQAITDSIAKLKQEIANLNKAYSGNWEDRIKNEPVHVLAITDFPDGFNDNALRDLNVIVRDSAAAGIFVLISTNEDEFKKLRNDTLAREIADNMTETKVNGGALIFTKNEYRRLFLQIDRMADVMHDKDKILQRLHSELDNSGGRIVYWHDLFGKKDPFDSNNWGTGQHDYISIPIGKEGNYTVEMEMGRSGGAYDHHALVAGVTGAGKSTFFHTLIMSALVCYSPEELQMYLLDFKEGDHFYTYTKYRLPHIRVIAVKSEPEFGLIILQELLAEFEQRARLFKKNSVNDINEYRKIPKGQNVPNVPRILLIIDEVQQLFQNNPKSNECLGIISQLVNQGREMGIHLILSCQNFDNCPGLKNYFHSMAIRIAINGTVEGISSILNSSNEGFKTLANKEAGAAIYNNKGGISDANRYIQIAYPKDDREKLLGKMSDYYQNKIVSAKYNNYHSRYLVTNLDENPYNNFSILIQNGIKSINRIGSSPDGYGLILGQSYEKKDFFISELCKEDKSNLMIIGQDEKISKSLFILSAMSILYEILCNNEDRFHKQIYIINLSSEKTEDKECNLTFLRTQFSNQIEMADQNELGRLIQDIHDEISKRKNNYQKSKKRIFLMFYGVDIAQRLIENNNNYYYDTNDMLSKIIQDGPKLGVNTIAYGKSEKAFEALFGDHYLSWFGQRVAYNLDNKDLLNKLTGEDDPDSVKGKTVSFWNMVKAPMNNNHFRPYDIPEENWVKEYAKAYNNAGK